MYVEPVTMSHHDLVLKINEALAPMHLTYDKVRADDRRDVLVLRRGPDFESGVGDIGADELNHEIRALLVKEPQVAQAVGDLDISLK